MTTPSQMLDLHGDLLERLDDPEFALMVAGGFSADWSESGTGHYQQSRISDKAKAMMHLHRQHVQRADLYRVTEDMGALLDHAAQGLNAEDEWDTSLAPTSHGLVRFDHPVICHDIRGRALKAHWLVWGPFPHPHRPAMLFTWYTDYTDPDDVGLPWMNQQLIEAGVNTEWLRKMTGRWGWVGAEWRANGYPVGEEVIQTPEELADEVRAEGDTPAGDSTNLPRYVHALWLMLNQTITALDQEPAQRAARRRAERENRPTTVTTVRLRRIEHASRNEGESLVEWHSRWIVRGHWRWQPYGTGRKQRRRIWIAPFIKGPEEAPLRLTNKVYDLSR